MGSRLKAIGRMQVFKHGKRETLGKMYLVIISLLKYENSIHFFHKKRL
jgi:hypothetical protein